MKRFTVDRFEGDKAVLECELESEDEAFAVPPELSILREVTGDPQYLNSSLARTIPAEDL